MSGGAAANGAPAGRRVGAKSCWRRRKPFALADTLVRPAALEVEFALAGNFD